MVYQSDDVYKDLRRRIIEEDLTPGAALVERDVSMRYEVSRTPAREALRQLVSDGLVVLTRGRGYTVRQLSAEDIIEVFVARESIEGTMASLAASHVDDSLRVRLNIVRGQIERLNAEDNPKKAIELGSNLHDILAEVANNTILFKFYQEVRTVAALTRNLSKNTVKSEAASREEHLQIIDSVLAEKKEEAESLMRLHLHHTCERMIKAYLRKHTAYHNFLHQTSATF